jgi:hypothetical protein
MGASASVDAEHADPSRGELAHGGVGGGAEQPLLPSDMHARALLDELNASLTRIALAVTSDSSLQACVDSLRDDAVRASLEPLPGGPVSDAVAELRSDLVVMVLRRLKTGGGGGGAEAAAVAKGEEVGAGSPQHGDLMPEGPLLDFTPLAHQPEVARYIDRPALDAAQRALLKDDSDPEAVVTLLAAAGKIGQALRTSVAKHVRTENIAQASLLVCVQLCLRLSEPVHVA